jgi:transposase-like protein
MPSGRTKQNDSIMRKEGRKTKYTPELVKRICGLVEKDTYTVSELCESVGISETTFYDWKVKFSEFSDAIKKAEEKRRETFVVEAKNSILKKIRGYKVTEIKNVNAPTGETDSEGNPVLKLKEQTTITKYVQPDTTAIIFTLTNLDPEHWKNRQQLDGNIQSDVRFTGFRSVLPNVPGIEALTNNVRERSREKFLNEDNDDE